MPKRKRPTPKQRKLIEQLPAIVEGKKTKKAALLEAGYSENTADKQAEQILGSSGVRPEVEKAMRKAGITMDKLMKKLEEGLDASRGLAIKIGGETTIDNSPDFLTRHKYIETSLKLKDAFPATKTITAEVGLDEMIKRQEATGDGK